MNLGWRIRRLRSMSSGEVVARVHRTGVHHGDAALHSVRREWWKRGWTPRSGDILLERVPDGPLGFLNAERARWVGEHAPGAADQLIAEAAGVLAGRYRYFGYPTAHLPETIDYARDPFSGRPWPRRHGKRIDYRLPGPGDPKWIWELNRLQELPLLAAASLLANDDRYVRHGTYLALRWIDTVEPGRGIAWSNGFEGGMRAISLALFLDAVRGSTLVAPAAVEKIVVSLWQHARWIRRDPSTHSSANNHLIGEFAGLVAIGLLAPELREGEALLARGLSGLARESERQIAPDGTSVEQAYRYHLFVLEHLLVAVALLDAAGRSCPAALTGALGRSGRALAAQLGESEPEPTYGDGDDAVVVRLGRSEPRSGRAMAGAIAARLGDRDARAASTAPDALTYWLFGKPAAERFERTKPAPAVGSVLLPDAGLAILRAGRRRVMVDAGPLGYLAIAAHGHADALQVTLSDGADDLVVDPGVGSYFARPEVRAALRGTAAHPTVTVDGNDQSGSGGPFLWTRHAPARIVSFSPENGVVVVEHNGYGALPDRVSHRRLVRVAPAGPIVVVDRLLADAAHSIVQSWPLHPSLDARLDGEVVRVTRNGRPRALIAVSATIAGRVELHRGERAPLRGWYSRRLEHLEPAWLATWSTTTVGPLEIVALLWPLDADIWPEASLAVERTPGELRIHYRGHQGAPVELRISLAGLAFARRVDALSYDILVATRDIDHCD